MRRITLAIVTVVAALGIGVGGASADANPPASCNGAAHGAFGYFDGDTNLGVKSLGPGTPTYHGGAVGQEPGATGSNNSTASQNCKG